MDGQQQRYPAQGYQGDPRQAQRGYPPQQQAQQEVPDYLAMAGAQLFRVARSVDAMSKAKGDQGELDDRVIELRFKLAEGLTALADIQYSVPDDGEGDEEDPDDSGR
jgi:hypothetical protein